jgi:DNA polymerase III epsilon subunit family exonuclease
MALPPALHQPIDESDFLVVDVETTGLSARNGDRICEIGAVRMRGSTVVDTFGTLINPCRPISRGAAAVNGITDEQVASAPTFEAVAPRLSELMRSAILVAYNAPFDVSFLEAEFCRLGHTALSNTVVDALAIARQLLPGLGKYPQENVARAMGIPFPVKHRALQDATVTAQVFLIFASILRAHDCLTCADLQRSDLASVLHQKRTILVEQALTRKQNLHIRYLSQSQPHVSERLVTPITILRQYAAVHPTSYLVAYCHEAREERTFRLDRLLDIRLVQNSTM